MPDETTYEQQELDLTSEDEQVVDEAIGAAIERCGAWIRAKRRLPARNRHEGYGLVADVYQDFGKQGKDVKDSMNKFLDILSITDARAVDAASSLHNSAVKAVKAAVYLAAMAEVISNDLYRASGESSPIEDMLGTGDFEDVEETEGEEPEMDPEEDGSGEETE